MESGRRGDGENDFTAHPKPHTAYHIFITKFKGIRYMKASVIREYKKIAMEEVNKPVLLGNHVLIKSFIPVYVDLISISSKVNSIRELNCL